MRLSALGPSAPPAWLWRGYLARGHSTLFTGLWKAGKTTLIGWLLRDLQRGGGLVPTPAGIKTLIVSEESASLWTKRRDDLGLDDSIHVLRRPFKGRPAWSEWNALVGRLVELVAAEGYGLVILDTLPSLWPVMDENDAAAVGTAVLPLNALTEAGAALLPVHHPRKGDAGEGQASRGSGALPAWADVIVELRRYASEDAHDRRRVLRAYARFDDTPAEAVLELGESGYAVIGDRATVGHGERLDTIGGILNAADVPLTVDEVRDCWPTEPKPGTRAIQVGLNTGADGGRWERIGTGRKGDPHRFRRAGFVSRTPTLLDARNESDPEATPAPDNGGGRET